MRFDWYQASLRVDVFGTHPERLAPLLADHLGDALGLPLKLDTGPGRYGYAYTTMLRGVDGDAVAGVYHGGNRWPNCWASGDNSPALADFLRGNFPARRVGELVTGHLLTRADVALDFRGQSGYLDGDGYRCEGPMGSTFERLQRALLPIADVKGLSISQAGDWHRMEKGRTLYVGSRKSDVFCRLYEKGLEQVSKAACEADRRELLAESDWVRLELVVKPQKEGPRCDAAQASPEALWGFSQWASEAYAAVRGVQVPRYERKSLKVTDDERTLGWMIRQYGPLLARQAERLGGWLLLGDDLEGRYLRSIGADRWDGVDD